MTLKYALPLTIVCAPLCCLEEALKCGGSWEEWYVCICREGGVLCKGYIGFVWERREEEERRIVDGRGLELKGEVGVSGRDDRDALDRTRRSFREGLRFSWGI